MIVDGKKWCTRHKDWADIGEFSKRSVSKDGLSDVCKACDRAYHRQHYKKKATKLVHRRSKLKLNYNITIEKFNEMYEEQGGACAICLETGHKLVVDHNHKTGEVRRLLCQGCNHALGRLKDNPEICFRAGRYLEIYGHS